ncbi:2-oxoglutarate dehydrogenase E2 component (dihydrolipoamide succinyltransferase) [Rhodobium orientis]|uniref:Dihydrolipoyllysine-residue succinyltransferase component of 2-oxoglutarate dehydrogenase complex n=1 Tax=Rhodobium orientis TaxID=34017 RepID=A0A327JS65_9HYPH|nr:2-oxoglutarate dehydrogenase complex dihydrolipoyllysine-residue succinyltransferase [Rhodobium orientis]MBB4304538.1 2-oxoglutarate dehydrogenase E2 component (dihydrolipoamide succinyltransferase) [Rhodobium orientis]MBK5948129.1 dihydrolipoamide succinyltransferase [Rhodobium orientis]RAI26208.1 dihydrolipoyllysine-residue succinyltransferase [Rhodobium orientis]
MATEIRVPTLGESVTEATIAQWFKKPGDAISVDEPLVELETDKVTIEVPAPSAGVLGEILVTDGETVEVGALLGTIGEGDGAAAKEKPADKKAEASKAKEPEKKAEPAKDDGEDGGKDGTMPPSPAAKKLMEEKGLSASDVEGSGKRGQILKEDVLAAADKPAKSAPSSAPQTSAPAPQPVSLRVTPPEDDEAREERVRMTKLRQTIARRLKDAQNTAAMLTTFNEVDMAPVMALRKEYKDLFEKKHGVKLGFMGFFVKAVCHALKEIPAVNGEIDGTDLVYKNYYHVGVAVGTDKGLVVPVVRDADRLSIAGIEQSIGDFGRRARDGKLGIEDMQGGTFTISNGGVYGSLMSTPILNAPQSGILGMHKIQERPMVVGGQVVVRPMMYLALSYDHRIVDGKEAVTFLVRVKESIEDPQRLILDL